MKKEDKKIFVKEILNEKQKDKLTRIIFIYFVILISTYFLENKYFHQTLLKLGFLVISGFFLVIIFLIFFYYIELQQKKIVDKKYNELQRNKEKK